MTDIETRFLSIMDRLSIANLEMALQASAMREQRDNAVRQFDRIIEQRDQAQKTLEATVEKLQQVMKQRDTAVGFLHQQVSIPLDDQVRQSTWRCAVNAWLPTTPKVVTP